MKEGAVVIVEWSKVLLSMAVRNLERRGCGNSRVVYGVMGSACYDHCLWLGGILKEGAVVIVEWSKVLWDPCLWLWAILKEGVVVIVEWSTVLWDQRAMITVYGWGNLERRGCGNSRVV